MNKRWQVLPTIDDKFKNKFPELNNLVLQLLYNRDLKTQAEIDDFLFPSYDDHVLDPFLFKDMDRVVSRIKEARAKNEKVMVYGDYDADGVCSTVILFATLKAMGIDVDHYIPYRDTEGYGLNKAAVENIINQGFNLVITVDCGISNVDEVKIFNEADIDIIITDHHQEPLKRPDALAIINPALKDSGYPFSRLCGAAVAFKVVQALMLHQEKDNHPVKLPAGFDKWLLDLVAVATVSDIMPLLNENRVLVKYGLQVLSKTKRLGLKKIIDNANSNNRELDTQFIGWRLAPRLNSAGRINHASLAFHLLMTEDITEADNLVVKLEANNSNRQQVTVKLMAEAMSQVEDQKDKSMLWAVGQDWPLGVVGLVAGRIMDRFHKPVMVITKEGETYRGSGRSIAEFDITGAMKKSKDYLVRFGGHKEACGFTAIGDNNFELFQKSMNDLASESLAGVDLMPEIKIDAEVKLEAINWELWEQINDFEPFGQNNTKPNFLSCNLIVDNLQPVGSDGSHLRLSVFSADSQVKYKFIGFSFGHWHDKLKVGDKIDIVFEVDLNEWNGNRELQLKIIDLNLSNKNNFK